MAEYGYNLLLMGAAGFAMVKIPPKECPYAFVASALGFVHGLCGLVGKALEGNEQAESARGLTKSLMEIVPLPLVNMELYYMSSTPSLALGHGLFIVPLAGELVFNTRESDSDAFGTLKELTIIGNCVSLLFLAINEGSYLYATMAAVAALSRYGGLLSESKSEGTGNLVSAIFDAVFFILVGVSVGDQAK